MELKQYWLIPIMTAVSFGRVAAVKAGTNSTQTGTLHARQFVQQSGSSQVGTNSTNHESFPPRQFQTPSKSSNLNTFDYISDRKGAHCLEHVKTDFQIIQKKQSSQIYK